jgi:hypothetical protein
MLVIASHEPGSQQQAAQRLGIDRTSMVARIDALEDKRLREALQVVVAPPASNARAAHPLAQHRSIR